MRRGSYPSNPPHDSTTSFGYKSLLYIFDFDGNLLGKLDVYAPIRATPSAGLGGAFFTDESGRIYKSSPQGYFLGSARNRPPQAKMDRQPIVLPNRKVLVQSETSLRAYDYLTGDSLFAIETKASPVLLNNVLLLPADSVLYGNGVSALGVADGWARPGREGGNSSFQFNRDPRMISGWISGLAYQTGDRVLYNGILYVAMAPHNSKPGWEPSNAPRLWQSDSLSPWISRDIGTVGTPGSSTLVSVNLAVRGRPSTIGKSTGNPGFISGGNAIRV